jgi:hypothetical protein
MHYLTVEHTYALIAWKRSGVKQDPDGTIL